MKTKETTEIRAERIQFWRGLIENCTTPEQAIAALEQGGLSTGRAIRFMAAHSPRLYNQWRTKPPESMPSKNPRMGHFTFRTV